MQSVEQDPWIRHRGPVTSVAAVPGTRTLVTAGYDGAVALYELDTGATTLLGHHGHLANEVVVDATGCFAASASSDYTVGLWDLRTRQPVRSLVGHTDDVDTFIFLDAGADSTAPAGVGGLGGLGASGSHDQRILLWDLATGAVLRVFEGHEGRVTSLACHEGTLYSTGHDHTLRLWDLETGALLRTIGPFAHRTDTCSLDLRTGRLALGCDDGVVRVFALSDGRLLHAMEAHASGIKKVTFSPATGALLSAAYDQKIIVWDAVTYARRVVLDDHPSRWERSFSWAPDGRTIRAGTFDGTVLEWDAETGRQLREVGDTAVRRGNPCFNRIAAEADGRAALVSDDGVIRLARLGEDSATWDFAHVPAGGRVLMNAVAMSTPHGLVAAGTHDQRVVLLRLDADHGLRSEQTVPLGEGPINAIAVRDLGAGDFELFVACYSGCVARVASDGRVSARHRLHGSAVKAVRLHPTQPLGLSCDAERVMCAWDLEGNPLQAFVGHTALINDADLDPTGRRVASVGRDFALRLWALDTGRLEHSVFIGKRSLKSVCFATETTVLVGDYWGHLYSVDLTTDRVTGRTLARNGVSSLSRCGAHVAACSYDGTVHLVEPVSLASHPALRAMRQRVDAAGRAVP